MRDNKVGTILSIALFFFTIAGVLVCSTVAQDDHGRTAMSICAIGAVRLSSQRFLGLVIKQMPVMPPAMLHNSELHGIVIVEVCIDKTGTVSSVRAVKGHPLAISSTIESVRNWNFAPYKRNGQAKPALGLLHVKYDFRAQTHESHPSP